MDTVIGTDVHRAAAYIKAGRLVGMPTETVYGLAADAMNEQAVLGVFKAKKRPFFDPLIVHVATIDRAKELVTEFPKALYELAVAHWPGPLTLLLPKKSFVPDMVTSGLNRVAIRIPAHPLALQMLAAADTPVAAPSANPFGYISPTTAAHVVQQLGNEVAYVLDGGACSVGLESTIVGLENGRPTVYRKGGLSVDTLREALGSVDVLEHSNSNPQAPGSLQSHYAPRVPFVLGSIAQLLQNAGSGKLAIIFFKEAHCQHPAVVHTEVLAPNGSTETAARHLFAAMRRADASGADFIFCEPVPEAGLGLAINDRLRRAAAK